MRWARLWVRETLRDIVAKLDLYRDRIIPCNLFLRETVSDAGAKLELYGDRLGGGRFQRLGRLRWVQLLLVILIILPLALQAWLIFRYGTNIPIADEWAYVPFVRRLMDGGDWWSFIFRQHNENRYAVVRLMMAGLVPLTRWNLVAELYLSLVPTALALLGVWLIYRRAGNRSLWLFLPAAWLLIHASQFANFLHGIQFGFLCAVAGAVWTVYLLNRGTRFAFAAAIACAVFGTYSAASGLVIWLAGLGQLVLQRASWRRHAIWVVSAGIVYALYFYNFTSPNAGTNLASSLTMPRTMLGFFGIVLGAVLGADQILWSRVAAGAFLLVLAILVIATVETRQPPAPTEGSAWGLVLFGLLASALISFGRTRLGLAVALESRYISISVLFCIGVYFLLVTRLGATNFAGVLNWIVAPLLLTAIVATNYVGWQSARQWARNYGRMNQFILQTQKLDAPLVMDSLLAREHLKISIVRDLPYLKSQQLTFFSEPVRWWLILPRMRGARLEPIVDNAVVRQEFVCMVDTLYDLSVIVTKPGVKNTGPLTLTLVDIATGATLGSRVADTFSLDTVSRISMILPQPVQNCQEKTFRLELSSPQTAVKNAVASLSYPQFYRGSLSQGGKEIPERSLGMELNTQEFDIRDAH